MGNNHRVVDTGILSHIYNINFQLLAVLGSRGFREKKNPNCHKYATFEGSFFCFHGQKYCNVRTKKLHNISFITLGGIFFLNFCLA